MSNGKNEGKKPVVSIKKDGGSAVCIYRDAIFQTVVFKQRNKATQVSRGRANQGRRAASPEPLSWEWSWNAQ